MHKFKALMIKDWFTHKKMVLVPFWITLGFYVFILLGAAAAYFKGDINLQLSNIQASENLAAISYVINSGIVILPGLISLIFTTILTQGALNEDIQNNSELFHRSQPVSIWFRSGSKFAFGIASNWLVLVIIALINFVVINIILAIFQQFEFYPAFAGLIQTLIKYMKLGLIIGSLAFFCSSIFKDKAFFQGFAITLAVQILFLILNTIYHWNLPLPLSYIIELIKNSPLQELNDDITMKQMNLYIANNWKVMLINWKTVIQIVVSGMLFTAGTLIYKNKEIK